MKKILVWGLLAVLGMACYDDLGNYDYNDINDMVLEMPRSVSVTIPKKDSVLVEVKAAVTQLDRKDNANLTYLWKKNLSGVTWTECGTDSVCRIWVYPKNSGQITLRLAVTDTVQNIVTFGETVVKPVRDLIFALSPHKRNTSEFLGRIRSASSVNFTSECISFAISSSVSRIEIS